MKPIIFRHCIAALSALILSSCGLISDANAVKDPTVDQMAALDKQWGLKPRETRQRTPSFPETSTFAPAPQTSAISPVPFPSTPASPSQSVPLPPSEAPPIPPSLR